MTAKTGAQIQADFRARRAAQGLTEVRGIFLPANLHRILKKTAKSMLHIDQSLKQLSKQEKEK